MSNEQKLKAEARLSAKAAPKPDAAIGKAARAEAEAAVSNLKSHTQPVYATQTKPGGDVIHRGAGVPMSEFSDPAANTVRAGKKGAKSD